MSYRCAHCGLESGMYGHNQRPWLGGPPICPNSHRSWATNEGRQMFTAKPDEPGAYEYGFCCPVGHTCSALSKASASQEER